MAGMLNGVKNPNPDDFDAGKKRNIRFRLILRCYIKKYLAIYKVNDRK